MEMEIVSALLTLTAMEIVLGIDNIVFIAILVARVEESKQKMVRSIGISLALVMRLGLLFCIQWLMGLTEDLFSVFDHGFSGRDLILVVGGLFLIGKATFEIHHKVEGDQDDGSGSVKKAAVGLILAQIVVLDLVFSLDSVITAVGMVEQLWVMVVAMSIAMLVMLVSAGSISRFVEKHPTVKILALSFLLLIGVMLVAEGMGQHIGKGYIYFAMVFSLAVELLNMRYRTKRVLVNKIAKGAKN